MAYDFESDSGQYLTRATPLITSMSNFTISIWFKMETASTYKCLVCNGVDGGYGQGFALAIDDGNSVKGLFPYVAWIGGSSAVSTGTWYHAAMVRSSGSTQVYLDGATAGSASSSTPYSCDGASDTCIGVRRTTSPGFDWYFDGKLAEAALWNTALTSTQIGELAGGAEASDYASNLLFYKTLNDSDTPLTDTVDADINWTNNYPSYDADHPIGSTTSVKDFLGSGFIPFAR